eukprot:TRINITY_DN91_c0_g2_i7.p1 TRINITY_DN91_c0_g2~~TRINITY_DN91_c0_g2_i7.p1  ORF type:complete len:961 (-),score=236.17 TRINITY_DN91_c0_g2_i7:217-3099(-)
MYYNMTHEQCYKQVEDMLQLASKSEKEEELEIKNDACNFLLKVINNKRNKDWNFHLQNLLLKYIDLSCELNRQNEIKDTLVGYRNLTQATNFDSLKQVLDTYLKIMQSKFMNKISLLQLDSKEIQDTIKDIDQEEQSEDILFINFSDENKAKKNEIKSLMKQLWDTYKCIFETVKTNKMLFKFQIEIIEKAVQFCKEYKRINELKRFIDTCKKNLSELIKPNLKYKTIVSYIDFQQVDINEAFIESRFKIYGILKEMQLYQECFKVLEDIQLIFSCRSRRLGYRNTFQHKYFLCEKLSEIFQLMKFQNYHAFFLLNQHIYLRNKKNATETERRSLINKLIIATLSIPQKPREVSQSEDIIKKLDQFISSSNFNQLLKKQGLIDQINSINIIHMASPQVQEIYSLYHQKFNILQFGALIQKIVALMNEIGFNDYIPMLKEDLIQRAIQHISKIYSVIKFENFMKILQITDKKECLQILLQSNQQLLIQCKLNQQQDIIIMKQNDNSSMINSTNQIINFAFSAKQICDYLSKGQDTKKHSDILEQDKKRVLEYYADAPQKVHQRLKMINDIRNQFKKYETDMSSKQEQEQMKQQQQQRQEQDQELQLEKDKQQYDKELIQQKKASLRTKINEIIKMKGDLVIRIGNKRIEQIDDFDLENQKESQIDDIKAMVQKHTESNFQKINKQFKNQDYLERERRLAQKEVLEKKVHELDKAFLENQEKQMEQLKSEFKETQMQKQQLEIIKDFNREFQKKLMEKREQKYKEQNQKFNEELVTKFKEQILEKANTLYEKQKNRIQKQVEELQWDIQYQQLLKQREIDKMQKDEKQTKTISRQDKTAAELQKEGPKQPEETKSVSIRRNEKQDVQPKQEPHQQQPESKFAKAFSRNQGSAKEPEQQQQKQQPQEKHFTKEQPQQKGFSRNFEKKEEPRKQQQQAGFSRNQVSKSSSGPDKDGFTIQRSKK